MPVANSPTRVQAPVYNGVRLSAREYFETEDDGHRYELVHGVMVMSPSPIFQHQRVIAQLLYQIERHVCEGGSGDVCSDLDVHLGPGPDGGETIYRPDLVYVRADRLKLEDGRLAVVPDLVVEVASPSTRRRDHRTKREDYEHAGVFEYWIVDADEDRFTFLRLQEGRYVEIAADKDRFTSEAVPGLVLDMTAVRDAFRK